MNAIYFFKSIQGLYDILYDDKYQPCSLCWTGGPNSWVGSTDTPVLVCTEDKHNVPCRGRRCAPACCKSHTLSNKYKITENRTNDIVYRSNQFNGMKLFLCGNSSLWSILLRYPLTSLNSSTKNNNLIKTRTYVDL